MRSILLITFFSSFHLWSQDTVFVYFDFGSAKVNVNYQKTFGNFSSDYDLSLVDSIKFVGYTDSIGKLKANLRLSRKRAKNVYRMCKNALDENTPVSILARGEDKKEDAALNRRVAVILYYRPSEILAPEIVEEVDPRCFFIDFEALEYCHTRTIKKRRKELIQLEALYVPLFKTRTHYYAREQSNGNVKVQRVRWKIKSTGMLWWKKKRYVATIPKTSFDKFHFFTLEDTPCDGCSEEVVTKDTLILTKSIFYADRFLINNAQLKVRYFGKGKLKIRAPREYIDISDQYYFSLNARRSYSNQSFGWETRRGKRRQNYFYAKIPIVEGRIPWIKRMRLTSVCMNDSIYITNNDNHGFIDCGFPGFDGGSFRLDVELGTFYQVDSLTGYFALGTSYTSPKSYTAILGGINTHSSFYGAVRYQYNYFTFPLRAMNVAKRWEALDPGNYVSTIGRFYIGTEMKTSFNRTYQSFMEGNLHLGFLITNSRSRSTVPRFFIQGGIARDFIDHASSSPYGFVQVGFTVNMNIFY